MMEPIELNDSTFAMDILNKTTFFQIAEGGAMGDPGGIVFLTDDGRVYQANYCFGGLRWETIQHAFPVIDQCHFGMFGIGSQVPDNWVYVNLGMGNHLIVRQDRYAKFASLIAKYKSPGEIYRNWLKHALSVN